MVEAGTPRKSDLSVEMSAMRFVLLLTLTIVSSSASASRGKSLKRVPGRAGFSIV